MKAEELPKLDELLALGLANGVEMSRLTAEETRAFEPHVPPWRPPLPNTGIVNAPRLMDCLLHLAREAGALLQPRAEVTGLAREGRSGASPCARGRGGTLTAERRGQRAGLEADTIAGLAGIDVEAAGYRQTTGRAATSRPIVQGGHRVPTRLPVPATSASACTRWWASKGACASGPTPTTSRSRPRLPGGREQARRLRGAVRRLVPELADEDLDPDMAGIRPSCKGRAGRPRLRDRGGGGPWAPRAGQPDRASTPRASPRPCPSRKKWPRSSNREPAGPVPEDGPRRGHQDEHQPERAHHRRPVGRSSFRRGRSRGRRRRCPSSTDGEPAPDVLGVQDAATEGTMR
jgi:hypothetical protein